MNNWQKICLGAIFAIVVMHLVNECAAPPVRSADYTQTLKSGSLEVLAPSHHVWLSNSESVTLIAGGPAQYSWEGSFPTDGNRVWGTGEGTLQDGETLVIELPPPSSWPQGDADDFGIHEAHIVVHLENARGEYLGVDWDIWFRTMPSPTPTRTSTPTQATNTPTATPSPTNTATPSQTSTPTRTPVGEPTEFKIFLSWMSVEHAPPATATPTATRTPRPRRTPEPEPSATPTPPPTETPPAVRPTENPPTATRPPA